jgi:hypothetical protein
MNTKNFISLAFLIVLASAVIVAQPIITSFAPTSGPTGATVTISGSNFSTTAVNNIVYFGAVKATVSSATSNELRVTVPTGATYQPITVSVGGFTAYSNGPYTVTFPSAQKIDSSSFTARVSFVTGTYPKGIAITDFDGDGKPDIVSANGGYGSNGSKIDTISLFRNISITGSISAGSFAARMNLAAGVAAWDVAVGDIDGDGKPDIVVSNEAASSSANTVSVYRNTSTSGNISFAPKQEIAAGSGPAAVKIFDVDGDGKPDLVVTSTGTTGWVSIFRSTSTIGNISFTARLDFPTGINPQTIMFSDVDGDGKQDMMVSCGGYTNNVGVFRNTSTSGNISLSARVDLSPGSGPFMMVTADIDGDTKPDIIALNSFSNTISVFRNTSTIGSITSSSFASKVDFNTGIYPYGIASSDLDGDGKPDIVVVNATDNTISVFRNTSTVGSLTAGSFAPKVDFATGNYPAEVALGDLNGDGKPDIVVTDNRSHTISIFQNTIETAIIPPTISSFVPTSGPIGTTVTITGTNFSPTAANNIVYFGAVKATVTSATSTSLSVKVPIGATYQPMTVTVNGLTAYSNKPFCVTFPSLKVIDANSFATRVDFSSGRCPTAALGDLDGDGKPDLVTTDEADNYIALFRNISTPGAITSGSFTSKAVIAGGSPLHVAIGDLDGDGKPDLAVSNINGVNTITIFRNTSSSGSITAGSFAAGVSLATATTPMNVVIRDIDGDGKPDLVAPNQLSSSISIFRNTSSVGSITTSSFAARIDIPAIGAVNDIAVGDLDGDGKPDIVTANLNNTSISVYRNISNQGTISVNSFAPRIDFTTNANPAYLALSDLDGDDKPEIIVSHTGTNSISIFRNTSSTGSISASSFAAKTDFTTDGYLAGLAIGDLDGDGRPDIAVGGLTSKKISILKNTSTPGSITISSFTLNVTYPTGNYNYSVAIGDLDGDGLPDIVVTNTNDNNFSIFRNTMISVPPTITSFTPTAGSIGTTVTITGTNFNTTAANNIVYFGAVKGTVITATTTQLLVKVPTGATYQPITVTVNGLTAYSSASFIITFPGSRIIDANSFSPSISFTTASGSQHLVVCDMDGDGKPDILVTDAGDAGRGDTISVLRNISTSGSITANSLAPKVDFQTGGKYPWTPAIGDLDGDGKPDFVVPNATGNNISIFLNTSIAGSFTASSFAPRIDLATGNLPTCTAIGDLDGDGKPDIAVSNASSNTVSVFRNIITAGSMTTSSFAAKVDFTTGTYPNAVAICDVDGDGHPDLVVANYNNNTISVLRNTSTSGSISFALKVDFTAGQNPCRISVGDLDGDGKSDFIITNVTGTSNTVSIFRNTSTPGSITTSSLAPKVDIITGTAPWEVALGDVDGDGKPDIAVSNDLSSSVSVFKNISTPGSMSTSSFVSKIDFMIGMQPQGIAFGDVDGDGKPDLVVAVPPTTLLAFRNKIDGGNTAPAAPKNLISIAGNSQVTLKWSKNTETDFVKYRIYMGSDSTSLNLKDSTSASISDTTKIITGLTNGTKYFFRVSALDSARLESGQSFAASATPTSSLAPNISLSAATIVFGSVSVGSTSTKSLVISNTGTASLTGTVSVTANAGYSINKNSISIGAGGQDSVLITFSPTATQNYNATLSIVHNAAGSPSTVALSGTGGPSNNNPLLVLSKSRVLIVSNGNFASLVVGSLNALNNGTAVLTGTVSYSGASNFSVSPISLNIPPGGSTELNITVYSLNIADGTYSGTITIVHNAEGSPTIIPVEIRKFSIPTTFSANHQFSFASFKKGTDYQLIGIPGITITPASSILKGTYKQDWRMYRDNGNASNYLTEYDGTSIYNFGSGKGCWALANQTNTFSATLTNYTASGACPVALQSGWNIISNPYARTVLWSDVQTFNQFDANAVIYSWNNGVWSLAATLVPYSGYYFYNIGNVSSVSIPYDANGTLVKQNVQTVTVPSVSEQHLKISLSADGIESSSVYVAFDEHACSDYDMKDYFAPPASFANANIQIENFDLSTEQKRLWIEHRLSVGEGQRFNLVVKNISSVATLTVEGIENFPDDQIFLLDNQRNELHDLKSNQHIDVPVRSEEYRYSVLFGGKALFDSLHAAMVPNDFILSQNYPNPFNPTTMITYRIPSSMFVSLKVFDIMGREIATLVNETKSVGSYAVQFNAVNLSGGVYLYRLQSGSLTLTKKLILLK